MEHLFRIPVLGLLGQPVAALQHKHLQATRSEMAGQGATTGSTANDHHIEVGAIGHLQLLRIGQGGTHNRRPGKFSGGGGMGHGAREISGGSLEQGVKLAMRQMNNASDGQCAKQAIQ